MSGMMLTAVATRAGPDPVDWIDTAPDVFAGTGTTNTQTITEAVTLRFDISAVSTPAPTMFYQKNGAGFIAFTNGATLAVARNDAIQFIVGATGGYGVLSYCTVTVVDTTNNNTLDSFYAEAMILPGEGG